VLRLSRYTSVAPKTMMRSPLAVRVRDGVGGQPVSLLIPGSKVVGKCTDHAVSFLAARDSCCVPIGSVHPFQELLVDFHNHDAQQLQTRMSPRKVSTPLVTGH
jgi:hypothetical protein